MITGSQAGGGSGVRRRELPGLTLRRVRKRYGRTAAVHDLDLVVRAGEILALVGPSGCGKSTLLRLIAGLEPADAGAVDIAGATVTDEHTWRPPEQRNVGLVFQDYALFPHLTVERNVAFGLNGTPREQRQGRIDEVLELVAMTEMARRYPHELSGGEQQRVALARAIAPEPDLVLLDEPFSNLDRHLRAQVRADTVAILRKTQTTAILVTHDQAEAMAVGDRVAVMRAGGIEQIDDPDVVFHTPSNRFVATFMGEADFLPAHVEDERLVTEAGTAPLPPGLRSHEAGLDIMVRPHEVTLGESEDGNARVIGTEFQGGFVLHTVVLDSGRQLRSLQPHTVHFPIGTRLRAQLAHGHPPAVLPHPPPQP